MQPDQKGQLSTYKGKHLTIHTTLRHEEIEIEAQPKVPRRTAATYQGGWSWGRDHTRSVKRRMVQKHVTKLVWLHNPDPLKENGVWGSSGGLQNSEERQGRALYTAGVALFLKCRRGRWMTGTRWECLIHTVVFATLKSCRDYCIYGCSLATDVAPLSTFRGLLLKGEGMRAGCFNIMYKCEKVCIS